MLRQPSPVFSRILDRIVKMPVVDCHEHLRGPDLDLEKAPAEPILALTVLYFISDLWAAAASDDQILLLQSNTATTDEKWPVFSRLWAATEHTAYARVTKLVLKEIFGVEKLTREALDCVAEGLTTRNPSHYLKVIDDAGIKAVIADVLFPPPWERPVRYFSSPVLKEFLEGGFTLPDIWHPVFNLPYYHEIRFREFINFAGALAGVDVTSLAEYEEAIFKLIKRGKDMGVIALKDQSAYRRMIAYDLPARSDAPNTGFRLRNPNTTPASTSSGFTWKSLK